MMEKICCLVVLIGFVMSVSDQWNGDCDNPPDLYEYDGQCCYEDEFFVVNEYKYTKIINECAKKFNLPVNSENEVSWNQERIEEHLVCYASCIYEASNYTKKGVLNLKALKYDANHSKNPAELKNIYINAIDACGKSTEKAVADLQGSSSSQSYFKSGCSPTAVLFNQCLNEQYLKNCPDKYWTNDTECVSMKEYTVKCL